MQIILYNGRKAGCSSPTHGRWARRWINHLSPWRMASATPDLRLPFQPQGITARWPVPNYRPTAWWQRHVCEQLAQGCYLTVLRARVDPGTFRSPVRPITIRLPSHTN